jgi:hypothetical protein
MENEIKKSKSSNNILEGKYRIENINNIIIETKNKKDLFIYYIDYIRNYREFTEEMIENIKYFDDNSKFLLIKEYNNIIKSLNLYFNNIK